MDRHRDCYRFNIAISHVCFCFFMDVQKIVAPAYMVVHVIRSIAVHVAIVQELVIPVVLAISVS